MAANKEEEWSERKGAFLEAGFVDANMIHLEKYCCPSTMPRTPLLLARTC